MALRLQRPTLPSHPAPLFKLSFVCDNVESTVGPTDDVEERFFLLDPEQI